MRKTLKLWNYEYIQAMLYKILPIIAQIICGAALILFYLGLLLDFIHEYGIETNTVRRAL
jgi:hypothetical protein